MSNLLFKFNTHQTGQFESFNLMTGYSAVSFGQVMPIALLAPSQLSKHAGDQAKYGDV